MVRSCLLAVLALALGACSRFGDPAAEARAEARWQERQQAAAAFDSWDLRARAALRLKGEAYNISLSWRRDAESFRLLLEAPFGQGVFRITAPGDGTYRLRLPDGRQLVNSSAEALLEEVVGSLPISGLEYWIRGVPQPGGDYSRRIDADGRARSISQDQWNIRFLDYFDAGPGAQLPRRIELARDELSLKLVIERWQPAVGEADSTDLFPQFN